MNRWPGAVWLMAIVLLAIAVPGRAAETGLVIQKSYRGLTVGAVKRRSSVKLDIEPVSAAVGLKRVLAAIDLLFEESPYSVRAIETLARSGEVVVVYDPHFPRSCLSVLTIAAFFPEIFNKNSGTKQFVTVVGRYGAKWPKRELAAVLAHELVGHGMQHHRGRLDHVRTIDLECEAYLYEERAYQDLRLDKRSPEMIRFRRTLEEKWCKSLRTYMKRRTPEKMKLWERLNPDVPKILEVNLAYIESLRRSGATRRAIEIERRDGIRRRRLP